MAKYELDRETLQGAMDTSPFVRQAQIEVVGIDHGRETLTFTMPLLPEFERAPGTGQFHGGPIASLIDTAGCFALVAVSAQPAPTINLRIDYLRPAVDSALRAVARIRRRGKTVGLVDVEVTDDSNRLVAVGRGTFGTRSR